MIYIVPQFRVFAVSTLRDVILSLGLCRAAEVGAGGSGEGEGERERRGGSCILQAGVSQAHRACATRGIVGRKVAVITASRSRGIVGCAQRGEREGAGEVGGCSRGG